MGALSPLLRVVLCAVCWGHEESGSLLCIDVFCFYKGQLINIIINLYPTQSLGNDV